MATQSGTTGKGSVGGQKSKGSGAVKNVGGGKNPPVVQKAGATQDGKTKGSYARGKR
jgi:hypothetical protein